MDVEKVFFISETVSGFLALSKTVLRQAMPLVMYFLRSTRFVQFFFGVQPY
jgi:hypothetical protein